MGFWMGITQHPSAELRSSYAIGDIAPGMGLAIAAHMDFCRKCALAVSPAQRWRRAKHPGAAAAHGGATERDSLPMALKDIALGRWLGGGRGVSTARLRNAAGLGEAVHLLKARATAYLPRAPAAEVVLLLQGIVHAGGAAYKTGDFLHLASLPETRLRTGEETGCVCLIVSDQTLYRRSVRDWLLGLWPV
jgi:anti-sigma factor ChrR (cupin superfamily)